MATYQIHKNSVIGAANNISSVIYEPSAFSYRINPDFTFELPEFTFKSTVELDLGDKIIISETAAPTRQITFYVEKVKYDYARRMYIYTCPHVLHMLDKILAKYVPVSFPAAAWCDITPGYTQFNNQMGGWATQGQSVWSRAYWQATFLLKMLIRRATGLGIAAINSTAIDTVESPYTTRALDEFEMWSDMPWEYSDLALNINMTQRLGTEKTNDFNSDDFMIWNAHPTCLDLLRYLVAAMGITIDIFNSDYRMAVATLSTLPPDASLLGYSTEDLEPYRGYVVTTRDFQGFVVPFIFGGWDGGGNYTAYVFGEDPEDRTLGTNTGVSENTNETTRKLTLAYPNFFKIVGRYVNESSGYQSASMPIQNGEDGYEDEQMNSDALQAFWDGLSTRERCEIALPGLYVKVPFVEIDLAANRMRMEVLS